MEMVMPNENPSPSVRSAHAPQVEGATRRPCRRCAAIRLAVVCFTLVILAALFATMARAEERSWWQKGADLLQGAAGAQATAGAGASLPNDQIIAGLREALTVGTERVVSQLGQSGGFSDDPAIHIPLPDSLKTVQKTLDAVGMGGMMAELESRLNLAAEAATPKAKQMFVDAISGMSVQDAQGIYSGPNDAATRYFQERMSAPLAQEMQPVIAEALNQAGAVQMYDQVMGQYGKMPFVPDVKADLQAHVTQKGLDGIFHYLAQEEAAIRLDPAKRTTELLQKVFAQK